MPQKKDTVHLYCLCWNDERMLPLFFKHYDSLVDKYFVYDNGSTDQSIAMLKGHGRVEISHFDVRGDSFVDEERRLGDTIWRGSEADWVIVTDIDEHIHHPDLLGYLQQCKERGVTAIQSIGYEMVSRAFPKGERRLVDRLTHGTRSVGHDRLCIFDPQAITETNYDPGRHLANPEGTVVWPEYPEVLLLHYKQLGIDYLVARSAELMQGLRPRDLSKGWGVQYSWSPATIRGNWQRLNALSGPVPGLGKLKHMMPAAYAEQERVVQRSGLLDIPWYLLNYPDVESADADPLLHYCIHGWKEGRKPNFYFDPDWYRATYPALATAERNPLFDYITRGEREDACPSPHFDTPWYRQVQGLACIDSPLRHYLLGRPTGRFSPNPDFDALKYGESHPEVLISGGDPYEAYCLSNE